jgi:predicted GNAT superfamily acetyltransferase
MIDLRQQRDPYELRELRGSVELNAVGDLERRIWGAGVTLHPELLRAMQDEGALLAGAFYETQLVAFVFSFPTRAASVQHSHALGILEAHRNAGLGARLKWWQRAWCLERGIDTVRWTYDPLRLPNAKLNIHKLGATARVYLEDYYGAMPGINAGAPSDRVMAEWHLNANSVLQRLEGEVVPEPDHALEFVLPTDFAGLEPIAALEWRLKTRAFLGKHFAAGYAITGLHIVDQPAYLLSK